MSTIETQNKKLLNKLYTLLNEEKLIKEFSSYQVSKIESYFQFAEEIAESSLEEKKKILQTLAEYKNNENDKTVIGRLVPPIIAFKENIDRDPSEEDKLMDLITSLLQDFQLSTRWAIIISICDKIISFFPQKINELIKHPRIADILRFKQEAIEKLKGKKETKEILKTIIDIDKKDADTAVKYAKLIFSEDPEEAGIYFKRAAELFAKDLKLNKLSDIWQILIDSYYEDLKFFERLEKSLHNSKNYHFIIANFSLLVKKYKELEEWDIVIQLLNKLITIQLELEKKESNEKRLKGQEVKIKKRDSKEIARLRKDLIEAYKIKYKNHSLLDEFLKLSELSNVNKPITIGISDFEKFIVFDNNIYVYHRKKGVGKIKEINKEKKYVIIDFDKNPDQTMTLDMAISSLQALKKDHFWVRYYENPEELKKLSKENKLEFFKILLKSFNKRITLAQVKEEVLGKLVSKTEWNKWWQEARKLLKESPLFGFSPKKRDEIIMWDRELSYSEELENKFENVKEWDKKIEIALESLTVSPEITESASEKIAESFLKEEETKDLTKKIQIFLFFEFFQKVYHNHTILKQRKLKKEDIIDILKNLDNKQIFSIFEQIKHTEFKKQFIDLVIESREDYPDILKEILLVSPIKIHKYIIEKLNSLNQIDSLVDFSNTVFRKYREYPEIFLWLSKNILDNNWDEEYSWLKYNKLEVLLNIFRLLKPLDKIEKKGNKLKNLAIETIFGTQNITVENLEKSKIKDYILNNEESFIKRIYLLFKNTSYIPDAHKNNFLEFIKKIRPDIQDITTTFDDIEEETPETQTVEKLEIYIPPEDIIYTTKQSIEKMHERLNYLINVEMPENSREIGEAKEKGDLRENAEYKAALERQVKLQSEITKLEKEIVKAVEIDTNKIRTDLVSIGTKIRVRNQESGEYTTYTILGPWDADPDKNILSYASPLGKALLGKKVGEDIHFSGKTYQIESIEKAI